TYNGVDIKRCSQACQRTPRGPIVIGFAGRLVRGKGADVLVRSLARSSDLSITALVAGDGPDRTLLEALARRTGIASQVVFLGPQGDMPSFWRRCDLAVVPSHTPIVESFGLAAVEAMASGLPVIASRNGALPEVVANGRTGTIVPEDDPVSLATSLAVYESNPQLREQHGRRGRADCERRFDIDRCALAYVDLLGRPRTKQRDVA